MGVSIAIGFLAMLPAVAALILLIDLGKRLKWWRHKRKLRRGV